MKRLLLALCALLVLGGPAWADTLWVSGLESLMALDPDTGELKREIHLDKHRKGALYFAQTPDRKYLYLLSGGREIISKIDKASGKILNSWTLSESLSGEAELGGPKIAHARMMGFAIDRPAKRLLTYVTTSRRVGATSYKLDRLALDRPYLAVLDPDTGKRLATITDVPLSGSFVTPMYHPDYPGRFLLIGRDVDVIDLDRLPKGKPPVRATFKQVLVKHSDVRTPHMSGYGPSVIVCEWFHPEVSKGVGAAPYYTTDPIVGQAAIGLLLVDMKDGTTDELELGPPLGKQFSFAAVVAPDRKNAYAVFNMVHKVDLTTRRLVKAQVLPSTFYSCNMSPDGKHLYIFGGGARLLIVDPETLAIQKDVVLPSEAWDVMVLPD